MPGLSPLIVVEKTLSLIETLLYSAIPYELYIGSFAKSSKTRLSMCIVSGLVIVALIVALLLVIFVGGSDVVTLSFIAGGGGGGGGPEPELELKAELLPAELGGDDDAVAIFVSIITESASVGNSY